MMLEIRPPSQKLPASRAISLALANITAAQPQFHLRQQISLRRSRNFTCASKYHCGAAAISLAPANITAAQPQFHLR